MGNNTTLGKSHLVVGVPSPEPVVSGLKTSTVSGIQRGEGLCGCFPAWRERPRRIQESRGEFQMRRSVWMKVWRAAGLGKGASKERHPPFHQLNSDSLQQGSTLAAGWEVPVPQGVPMCCVSWRAYRGPIQWPQYGLAPEAVLFPWPTCPGQPHILVPPFPLSSPLGSEAFSGVVRAQQIALLPTQPWGLLSSRGLFPTQQQLPLAAKQKGSWDLHFASVGPVISPTWPPPWVPISTASRRLLERHLLLLKGEAVIHQNNLRHGAGGAETWFLPIDGAALGT